MNMKRQVTLDVIEVCLRQAISLEDVKAKNELLTQLANAIQRVSVREDAILGLNRIVDRGEAGRN